jgi:hypothetical protein
MGKMTLQPAFLLESINKEGAWNHTKVMWVNCKLVF